MNAHGVALDARTASPSCPGSMPAGRWAGSSVRWPWRLRCSSAGAADRGRAGGGPAVAPGYGAGRSLGHGSARGRQSASMRRPEPSCRWSCSSCSSRSWRVDSRLGRCLPGRGSGRADQVAAYAYAALSVGLFLGRIGGDWVKDRIGSVRLSSWACPGCCGDRDVPAVRYRGRCAARHGGGRARHRQDRAADLRGGRAHPAARAVAVGGVHLLTLTFMTAPTIIGVTTDTASISVARPIRAGLAGGGPDGAALPCGRDQPALPACRHVDGKLAARSRCQGGFGGGRAACPYASN